MLKGIAFDKYTDLEPESIKQLRANRVGVPE